MTKIYEEPKGLEFDFEETKTAVRENAKKAVKKIPAHLNGLYVLIAAASLGLMVYLAVGVYAAAERSFNGGVGGEVLLAAAIFVGVRLFWNKIKSKLTEK